MKIFEKVSVAIIGGGMSGVSAAYSFALSNKHGISDKIFDFVVYEAQDRIGGNAYTFEFPLDNGKTHPVDLGIGKYFPSSRTIILSVLLEPNDGYIRAGAKAAAAFWYQIAKSQPGNS